MIVVLVLVVSVAKRQDKYCSSTLKGNDLCNFFRDLFVEANCPLIIDPDFFLLLLFSLASSLCNRYLKGRLIVFSLFFFLISAIGFGSVTKVGLSPLKMIKD